MSRIAHLPAPPPRACAEEEAVIAVICAEARAFMRKDFDGWASHFVQDARTTEVTTGTAGIIVHRGWPEVAAAMRRTMDDVPEAIDGTPIYGAFDVTISGETAWATYKTTCPLLHDGRFDMPDLFETRVLERRKGRWKIVYMSVLSLRSGSSEGARVLLDREGRVVWASAESHDALKAHPHLTISAGRLRAARRDWDKVLQAAIRQAAKAHHLFLIDKQRGGTRYKLVIPVILGEDDDGGVQSCLVYVRDGGTYVAFDDGRQVARSLTLARAVFGLSEGQTRLAEHIAAGHGLTETAGRLGISVNTARTHLSRIYDKTGVNTQTALVRVLLGIGHAQH